VFVVYHRGEDLPGPGVERYLAQTRDSGFWSGDDAAGRDVALVGPAKYQQARHATGPARVGGNNKQIAIGIHGDADNLEELCLGTLYGPERLDIAVGIALVHKDAAVAGVAHEQLAVFLVDRHSFRSRQSCPGALDGPKGRFLSNGAAS